ncbi:MAG: serine/threonine-protein kinase [Polyangiaceae bacterium]
MDGVVSGVQPGDVLAGKYRIDRILGAGGMGVVVAAHHLRLDERVAIKFLLPDAPLSGEAVARFEREARAAVKIKSEHVARVSDVGTLENGSPYMVMEYLEGSDLSSWLETQGRLPFDLAADFVLQASEAIAEAHALGIVHRDLKPANLFVIRRPDGSLLVKVLDFGISKMRGGGSTPDVSFTRTSAAMGSPLYMSPEQMQSSKDVDARTDLWAIGVILYELVTGSSPFLAETMPELIAKILTSAPLPLASHRPDTPPGFEAVISRCLERDRERRYASIAELARDLLPFAPPRSAISLERISGVMHSAGLLQPALFAPPPAPASLPSSRAQATQTSMLVPATHAAWGHTRAPTGRRGVAVVASVTVALAAAGLLAWRALGPATTNKEGGIGASSASSQAPAATSHAAVTEPTIAVGGAPALSGAAPPPSSASGEAPAVSAAPPLVNPTNKAQSRPSWAQAHKRAVSSSPLASPVGVAPAPGPKPAAPALSPGAFDDRK